eukprot:1951551-Prymnesium_polylepis.1
MPLALCRRRSAVGALPSALCPWRSAVGASASTLACTGGARLNGSARMRGMIARIKIKFHKDVALLRMNHAAKVRAVPLGSGTTRSGTPCATARAHRHPLCDRRRESPPDSLTHLARTTPRTSPRTSPRRTSPTHTRCVRGGRLLLLGDPAASGAACGVQSDALGVPRRAREGGAAPLGARSLRGAAVGGEVRVRRARRRGVPAAEQQRRAHWRREAHTVREHQRDQGAADQRGEAPHPSPVGHLWKSRARACGEALPGARGGGAPLPLPAAHARGVRAVGDQPRPRRAGSTSQPKNHIPQPRLHLSLHPRRHPRRAFTRARAFTPGLTPVCIVQAAGHDVPGYLAVEKEALSPRRQAPDERYAESLTPSSLGTPCSTPHAAGTPCAATTPFIVSTLQASGTPAASGTPGAAGALPEMAAAERAEAEAARAAERAAQEERAALEAHAASVRADAEARAAEARAAAARSSASGAGQVPRAAGTAVHETASSRSSSSSSNLGV